MRKYNWESYSITSQQKNVIPASVDYPILSSSTSLCILPQSLNAISTRPCQHRELPSKNTNGCIQSFSHPLRYHKPKNSGNSPTPITTKNPVTNLPKSTSGLPPPSLPKSSGLAHLPQIQFGKGARTKVATTMSG